MLVLIMSAKYPMLGQQLLVSLETKLSGRNAAFYKYVMEASMLFKACWLAKLSLTTHPLDSVLGSLLLFGAPRY